MSATTPDGITPPAPGLEREEPEFTREEDIPTDDGTVRPQDSGEHEATGGDAEPVERE